MQIKVLAIFVLLFSGIILLLTLQYFDDDKTKILIEASSANYCEEANDCVNVGGKCPFGCYLYVNKNESERISGLISNYESNCVYSCIRSEGIECVDNRCKGIFP